MKTNQMPDVSALCFISEQTSYPEDVQASQFGYKVHHRGNRFFLIFDSCLQSFGVMNRNKRAYIAENIMDKINNDEYIQTQLRNNSWIGELDHPTATIANTELSTLRVGNPDPKVSSHYIRKPHLAGNLLRATIQTDSATDEGNNFAIKVVDGGIVPNFSARVFGALQNHSGMPTVVVKRLITYDAVLFPSHREAVSDVKPQFLESGQVENVTGTIVYFKELARMAANNSAETEWLCESFGLTIDDVIGVTNNGNSVVITEDKNVYVQPIMDKTVRKKVSDMTRMFLNQ